MMMRSSASTASMRMILKCLDTLSSSGGSDWIYKTRQSKPVPRKHNVDVLIRVNKNALDFFKNLNLTQKFILSGA